MPWQLRAQKALRELDLEPVRVLLMNGDPAEVLLPPPATARPRFEDQIEQLLATPPEWLERDLRRRYGRSIPAAARPYIRHSGAALHRLAETVRQYWTAVVCPWWPRLSTLLEQDLLYRAQMIARQSLLTTVNNIHPSLRIYDDALILAPDKPSGVTNGGGMAVCPGGIVFVASVFVDGRPLLTLEDWERNAVYYRARGSGALSELTGDHRPANALPILLSQRRADLIRTIRTPSTPGDLARTLGVTSSAVSQHLVHLMTAGVANRTRLGRRAYYELTASGRALLNLLDQTD